MKRVLLLLFMVFIIKRNYAQVDSSKRSSIGPIQYTRTGIIVKTRYYVNSQLISHDEAYNRLANYQASANEFGEYKKYKNLSYYALSAVLSCLSASLIANDSNSSFHTTSSKVFLGVGCALIIPEAIFVGKRNRHYGNSLQLYNQQFK